MEKMYVVIYIARNRPGCEGVVFSSTNEQEAIDKKREIEEQFEADLKEEPMLDHDAPMWVLRDFYF